MMKGLASLLLVAVLVCCGVENGCSSGAPVSVRFPLGAIGCLFTTRLCGPAQECVDDHLFGTCQDRENAKDYYQYLLDRGTLEDLEGEIWLLIQKGYSWRDAFTQCVLQNVLVSYREQTNFDRSICARPSKWSEDTEDDISNVLQSIFNYYDYQRVRKPELAAIEGPSSQDYIPDYSSQKRDEFLKIHKYFDPSKSQWKRRVEDAPYPPPTFEDYLVEKEVENVLKDASRDNVNYDDLSDDNIAKLRLYLEALQEATQTYNKNNEENGEIYPDEGDPDLANDFQTDQEPVIVEPLKNEKADKGATRGAFWSSPNLEPQGSSEEPEGQWRDEPLPGIDLSILETGEPASNNVDAFPDQREEDMDREALLRKGEDQEESANEISENGLTPHYAKLLADLLQDDLDPSSLSNKDLDVLTKIVNSLLENLSKEDTMAVADLVNLEDTSQSDQPVLKDEILEPPPLAQSLPAEVMSSEEQPDGETVLVKKADEPKPISYETPSKGENENDSPPKEGEPKAVGVVDASYVFLTTDKDISLQEGETLVNALIRVLGFPPASLTVTDVHDGRVTFQVSPEVLELYNGSSIATAAGAHERDLARLTGLNIVRAGIGSQDGEVKIEVLGNNAASPKFFVLTFVLCGCIAGLLIAVVLVYLLKRHSRSKDKLAQLATEGIGAEASQDYQDLCRQRMQSKTSEKPEPLHAAGRIGSVSESQVRSPSSRSSTSSWSEEPVTSNMDISTGHIVLSYMEDHLKNKGRLDQEWEALAAYEADPCSTIVASDPSNTRKNRYGDNVPYDHSRVVLADSSNVSGSDYINASTITDHDPRNPAYISTQGPLPHTVADFWQMVWEQGSVVVVMLTKLTENGAAMCHRYWPEEGSDLYHIYEVHLVSEHIWCDDYLVRSFYLKNLQTNETRTVTQFHFLTWQDNKVPGSVKALLDFRRKVNKSYRGRSCPIVVHCSDGSGRSGTYSLIDMVLNRLAKGAKEIDIAATLEHIRDQRMGMVKTKEQFEFALAAVAEEVHAILKSLPQ